MRSIRRVELFVIAISTVLVLSSQAWAAERSFFPLFETIPATSPMTPFRKIIDIDLINKEYVPYLTRAKPGDGIRICNKDPFFHLPFSYSKFNEFGNPKGVRIEPGKCVVSVIVQNPTKVDLCVRLGDEAHSQEKAFVIVSPEDGPFSWGGTWNIVQTAPKGNKFTGRMTLEQNADDLLTVSGTVEWDTHTRGTVYGEIIPCTYIQFWIEYGHGLIGTYSGDLGDKGNTIEINGTARSNAGGPTLNFTASR